MGNTVRGNGWINFRVGLKTEEEEAVDQIFEEYQMIGGRWKSVRYPGSEDQYPSYHFFFYDPCYDDDLEEILEELLKTGWMVSGEIDCCGEDRLWRYILKDGQWKTEPGEIVYKETSGKTYSIALMERPLDDGLNKDEVRRLYDYLSEEKAIPVEFQGENSSAMGFICLKTAEEMCYDYSNLEQYVVSILDDMAKENPSGEYQYAGYTIRIIR